MVVVFFWQALTVQCLLSYQKSPLFSDKFVRVQWMDGVARNEYVGENTNANDIVKRLCRGRKRQVLPGQDPRDVPTLVSDPGEWALFERQRHQDSDVALHHAAGALMAGVGAIGTTGPTLHKLPSDEPILDQLLLRWETAARHEYGTYVREYVPRDSFQLLLRKVHGQPHPPLGDTPIEAPP